MIRHSMFFQHELHVIKDVHMFDTILPASASDLKIGKTDHTILRNPLTMSHINDLGATLANQTTAMAIKETELTTTLI